MCDGRDDRRILASDWPKNGQEWMKSPSGIATSPAAITAMAGFKGGLKI